MRKKMKRLLTMLMTLALIITSVQNSTLVTVAADNITPAGDAEDKSWTADELTFNWASCGYTLNGDKYDLTFASQYKEIKLQLPETIDMSECSAVTFAVSAQSAKLALKLYDEEGSEITDFTKYDQTGSTLYTFSVARTEKVAYVGVMLGENLADQTATFDGVLFDMKASGGEEPDPDPDPEPDVTDNITPAGDAEDKSWTADELTFNWASCGYTLNGDKYDLTFASQYKEIKLQLPETIDMSECSAVTFAVSAQSAKLALKLYDEEGSEITDFTKYDQTGSTLYTFSVARTEKVAYVGVMLGENLADQTATFDGVLFDMKASGGEEPDPDPEPDVTDNITPVGDAEDKSWTADELTRSWGVETFTVDGDKMNLTLEGTYSQICLKLPEAVDMSKCESVTFAVSEQSGPIALKLYVDGTEKWVAYSKSGNTLYTYTPAPITEGSVNAIGFMLNDESLDSITAVIDGIYFDMVADGGGEEPDPDPEPEVTGNITPVAESAEDFSWKGDSLTKDYDTTTETAYDETNARWNVTFGGEWKEVRFTLPQEIDLAMLNSVTFAISKQSAPVCFKLYDGETEVWAEYSKSGKQLYVLSDSTKSGTADTIALMLHSNDVTDGASCSLDGVMFDMIAEGEVEETYEITYGYSDLIYDTHTASAAYQLVENGHKITFTALNEELRLKLPEAVNLENCKLVTFKVASQVGPVNFSLGKDSAKIDTFYYNVDKDEYTKEPTSTDKANTITVQCGGLEFTEGSTIIITGVTFVMLGKEPLPTPTDGVYNMNYFDLTADATDGVSVAADEEAGTADVTFANAGDSVTIAIPDSVDLNHLTGITVNGTDVSKLKIEVLDKNGKVLAVAAGNFVEAKCNPEFASIRFTSTAANVAVTLKNITFTVDSSAFEAIVLNGNFAREDVSMWKAALWGTVDGQEGSADTTITTAVSDTPIVNDIYTYGVLSRRSSPYVCFAQDITDRVKPYGDYFFEFYAKMSEDYKDAESYLSTIEFSPYYVNTSGKEIYSMKMTGTYKKVVTPDGWVKFEGAMYIPGDMEKVVIRIVEQGTNYGQGDCLLGSYYVTGVKMSEADNVNYPSNSGGGGGGSTNTTVTKEAVWIGTYDMDELLVEWASATYTKNKDDSLTIKFKNNYDEVRMDLPRELDMSTVAYVKTEFSDLNVPIAIKLYYKGSQVDVAYFNDIKTLYTWVPTYTGMIDAVGIMSLATPNPEGAFATLKDITFGLTEEPAPIPPRTTIVLNGDFSDSDLSDWKASFWGDGVTMTQKRSSSPIAPGVYNYASYSKRTSPYQCFAQDITEAVQEGETYTFSFWARLSEDYAGAPPAQRTIQFAPYTTDSNGVSDYNPKLDGTYAQVCEPGEWTYFEGTYKVTNPNDVKKVVIRIVEQGTNYGQGDCVLGRYDIANVKMDVYIPEPPSIDEDVPDLKDALTEVFGDDFIVSTAITLDNIDDIGYEMLINKHFNAITIGNELKPDALFNYSNDKHTELQTITFNGQSLEVPALSFYRAEEILDKILEWNEANPDAPIKVRGHVLVWHSQTPEWFFREGYVVGQNEDGTENYVTPEVMNLRLEWYTKTVLEHFTGENSPYKDLFYGWDVVNEAVRDGSTNYRTNDITSQEAPSDSTHGTNSSWWAVYQSNEFIINAFKYANMYAPADLELYYNDYNECDSKKVEGIVKLLTAVKEAEGTRIDGMGMQGHYGMMNPSVVAFEEAVRAYSAVIGKVMITEWDLKASGDISTDSSLQKEYLAQGDRYRDFYEVLKKLHDEGIDVGGVVFWGVIDPDSWLQTQSSVGGGADGTMTHCPLLFDGNYKVKPAYWAFVDYSVINPDYESPVKNAEDDKADADKADSAATDNKTDETVEDTADNTSSDSAKDDAEPADSKNTSDEEGSGVLPFAVGGGVVGVGALAGIVAFLKKRKRV